MKKHLFIVIISLLALTQGHAQTNVSGGIYSNTTWTLVNSPYIVTDTVVVFPGVTLTIQPGVVVKFNSAVQLEIRQGSLRAIGTNNDSITFTSNTSLTPSSWNEIVLNGGAMTSKFNYCNFRYAQTGLYDNGSGDSLIIKNSNFNFNTVGLNGSGTGQGIIDTCSFMHNVSCGAIINGTALSYCNLSYNNQTGLSCTGISLFGNIINNCIMNYNQTGIHGKAFSAYNCVMNYNQTGIGARGCSFYNCTVKHNQSGIAIGSSISDDNVKVKNTTIDSNTIVGIQIGNRLDSIINCQIKYNGVGMIDNNQDNAWINIISNNIIENNSIGLQLPHTYDNIYCNKICNSTTYDLKYTGTNNFHIPNNYFCTSDSASTRALIYDGYDDINLGLVNFMPLDASQCYLTTGIPIYEVPAFSFSIFPNPAIDRLTVTLPTNVSNSEIKIYNLLGELEYSSTETKQKTIIDVSGLTSGLHIIQIANGDKISRQKFIKK